MVKNKKIPVFVINWTDKYFHQSGFDIPLIFPNKRIISFLSYFKKNQKVKLYRGINKYNKADITNVKSWTYNKNIAQGYAEPDGKIIEKFFSPERILLDTTVLKAEQRCHLGYDHKTDDKEVLILTK